MVTTPNYPTSSTTNIKVTWEYLPDNFQLEEEPVDNTAQPLIAGALRDILAVNDYIKPEMLIATNFGLCATINDKLVIKAPDWVYVPSVKPLKVPKDRKSYTPYLEGSVPSLVMEFLSETEGGEYSIKKSYPPGKWFFYEQILKIPTYIIFNPAIGDLEVYHLQEESYIIASPNESGLYLMANMGLYLGVWQGTKEDRTGYWLRWWDEQGNMLPWALEKIENERQRAETERQRAETERQRAETEHQRAETEHQRAETEHQRAEKLAEYLRSQGIDLDQLD